MNLNYEINYDNVSLRPIRDNEIEIIRGWRNDVANTTYLRDIGTITMKQQVDWYNEYLDNIYEVYFSIYETRKINKIVGAISLYNIKNENAELGRILIGEKNAHGLGIGKRSLVMLMKFGFERLDLKKITGKVNKNNISAIINDIKVGFIVSGEQKSESKVGGNDFLLEIDYDRFKAINNDCVNDIEVKEI